MASYKIKSKLQADAGINLPASSASKALTINSSGDIASSTVTDTELAFLSGTTSSVQTQLSGKEPTITNLPISKGGTNSTVALNNNRVMVSSGSAIVEAAAITASRALASDANGIPTASATTAAELAFVSGVTSAIQTQINGKLSTGGGTVTGTIDMGSNKITTTYTPTNAADLTNKTYVDNLVAGLTWKTAARVASTANVNISSAPASIDGVTLTVGDRILLKNQTSGSENGIYTFPGTGGTLIRATDMDVWSEVVGAVLLVVEGSTNSGSKWVNTNVTGGTIGTTPVTFTAFSVSGTINGTGTASQVAYFSGTSTLTSEAQLATSRGGLGTNASAFSGLLKFSAGTASASSLVDADISSSAAISLSKLTTLSTGRALQSNASTGVIEVSSVTNTELGYVSGVTSAIQTQLNNKQPLAANLTSLAAYNTNGILVQTAANTFAGRTLTAGSTKVAVTNGDGVAGNPTVDVTEANLALNNIGGTLGISKGGTGQTTATAAFDALAPTTTKGDIIVRNATNNVRLAVGTDGFALVADSTQATGLKYAAIPTLATGDINPTSFTLANNQVAAADVTGLAFANGSVRSFKALVSVTILATGNLYELYELNAIQRGGDWQLSQTATGDSSQIVFSITNAGQVQYTSGNYTGFSSGVMKFRAQALGV